MKLLEDGYINLEKRDKGFFAQSGKNDIRVTCTIDPLRSEVLVKSRNSEPFDPASHGKEDTDIEQDLRQNIWLLTQTRNKKKAYLRIIATSQNLVLSLLRYQNHQKLHSLL